MSDYNISDHKDEIITGIIKNLIWLPIAGIIPLIGTLLYSLITKGAIKIQINIILIISILLFIISIVILYKINKKIQENLPSNTENNKDIENSFLVSPLSNFRIRKVECELYFEDRINILSTVSYELIANKDDIECFEKELMWTGKDYDNTEMIESNGNYKFEIDDSNEAMHKYKISFIDPIKFQDLIKFKLVTRVADSAYTMQPINSYMVKHQIDNLILRVVVPPNHIKCVKKSAYIDIYRQLPTMESETINKKMIAGNEYYEATFTSPTISHRCFIEWEFTNV